jgi:NAD(P)-dependent dehydrogenase (short-subunit alcohol dehydrogenase family)
VAAVTGGFSGNGEAAVRLLAEEGGRVAIGDVNVERGGGRRHGDPGRRAHCHLGLGKLYRRTDKREQAREHLITATTMYRERGMTYWLEKAEAEVTEEIDPVIDPPPPPRYRRQT